MWRFVVGNCYLLLAGLVLLLAVAVKYVVVDRPQQASAAKFARQQTPVLLEKLELVKAGMTKEQVEELLDPPTSTDVVCDLDVWSWEDEEGNRGVVFLLGGQDGTVIGKNQRRGGKDWNR
jgi:hypothetical protein